MNVTVFGSTGAIGKLVVRELIARGDSVTVHARRGTAVPPSWDPHVRAVIGPVTQPSSVERALEGADAVISALGPSMSPLATGMPLVEANHVIVAAMQRQHTSRFIGVSTPSFRDVHDDDTLQARVGPAVIKRALPRAYREMVAMSRVIAQSDLDWTLVRVPLLNNSEARGYVREGFFGGQSIGWTVTRGDVAAFVVAQLDSLAYVRAAPAISN